jgi:hypothetical protein
MGGTGSGNHYHWWRSGKKDTVEDCRWLESNRWMREGILAPNVWHTGSWCWFRADDGKTRTADITYEVNTIEVAPWVRLHYSFKATGDALDYKVRLATTRPQFGGIRWWFICPLIVNGVPCGRRVGKLYLAPRARHFGCRHCHELTYTSCQESHKNDCFYRSMARNTGYDFLTVKKAMDSIGKR